MDRFRKVAPAEFESELVASGVAPGRTHELTEMFSATGTGIEPARLEQFLADLVARGLDAMAQAGLARVRSLFRFLEKVGLEDRIAFDPTVVRGLAYYTSTVFEAYARSGDGRSVFGGGRYDHLIELFGGPATPAAGLAIGDQTLELLLKGSGRWPDGEPGLDSYVVVADAALTADAMAIVEELRRAGASADCDLMGRSMSREFKEAARRRSRRALILGLKEATPGALVERDLATGVQREVSRDAVARSG